MVADGKGRRQQDKGRGKGKGRTLPAEERPWHKAFAGPGPVPRRTARKQEKERTAREPRRPAGPETPTSRAAEPHRGRRAEPDRGRGAGPDRGRRAAPGREGPDLLVGRNPVVEALRARVPASALYLAVGLDSDDRVTESIRTAADRGLPILEVGRGELDRMTGGVLHQGVALQVPPYAYRPFDDLLAAVVAAPERALLVALDGVTDPRNLGAVIRSAAAFGAGGVFLPERRAAGITATAWRASAGAAARLPVARVTNLTRALRACQAAGCFVVGLDADAGTGLYDPPSGSGDLLTGPLVLVVGSEGRGLSRLVGATCDLRVAIPMASDVESLNANVAAAVALAEVSRRRGPAGAAGPP